MRRTLRSNSKAAPVNVVVDEEDSSVAVLNMEESHGQSEAAGGGDSLHSLMAGLSGDPSKLCELLVKNLSILQTSQISKCRNYYRSMLGETRQLLHLENSIIVQ